MQRLTNGPNFLLKVALAGGFAGCMAKTAVSPLSRLTILLQTGGIAGAPKVGKTCVCVCACRQPADQWQCLLLKVVLTTSSTGESEPSGFVPSCYAVRGHARPVQGQHS